jgi:hypothetical protein
VHDTIAVKPFSPLPVNALQPSSKANRHTHRPADGKRSGNGSGRKRDKPATRGGNDASRRIGARRAAVRYGSLAWNGLAERWRVGASGTTVVGSPCILARRTGHRTRVGYPQAGISTFPLVVPSTPPKRRRVIARAPRSLISPPGLFAQSFASATEPGGFGCPKPLERPAGQERFHLPGTRQRPAGQNRFSPPRTR